MNPELNPDGGHPEEQGGSQGYGSGDPADRVGEEKAGQDTGQCRTAVEPLHREQIDEGKNRGDSGKIGGIPVYGKGEGGGKETGGTSRKENKAFSAI